MIELRGNRERNKFPQGTTGTEIYAGYLFEEYLRELRGSDLADIVDKMRRSDAIVKMITKALKLPLLSQNWFIEKKEDTPEAEKQKILFERAVFNDMSSSFTKLLGEVLTFYEFGFSLFEIVHGIEYHKDLGRYNTIKKMAFRSQRTIEKWNLKDGELESVTQQADGDLHSNADMDARFLVHFALEMEGDNFEGISVLRPCYGPWLRKNKMLKLLIVALEKYSIPTPHLQMPSEKMGTEEEENAKNALECYTSNEAAYLIYPEGWKLDIEAVTIHAEKIRECIDKENLEMVNSVLASFLLLGQGGGGAFALSKDLSDFFAQTLQAAADHVSEVFEKRVFRNLIDINFSKNTPVLCELRCDSLRDRADEEFAKTLDLFVRNNIVTNNAALEKFIREKFKYPSIEDEDIPDKKPTPPPMQFSEGQRKEAVRQGRKIQKIMGELSDDLKKDFQAGITVMASQFVNDLETLRGKSSNIYQAASKIEDPSTKNQEETTLYLALLKGLKAKKVISKEGSLSLAEDDFYSLLASYEKSASLLASEPFNDQLRRETKKLESQLAKKASEGTKSIKGSLGFKTFQKIKNQVNILVASQAADVWKMLNLYTSSNGELEGVSFKIGITDKIKEVISGPMVNTAPDILANQAVSESVEDFEEVYAWEFVAEIDDKTTDICLAMNGTVVRDGDPARDEYQTPLHHNCRSVWIPIFNTSAKLNRVPRLPEEIEAQASLK